MTKVSAVPEASPAVSAVNPTVVTIDKEELNIA
jgi:hypothetical protein